MEVIIDIAYLYASLDGTFIRMFGRENPPRVLPRYATEKIIMQEVSYHLTTGLSVGKHRKKKAPWPALPLWVRLYEIKSLKYANVEAKDIVKFEFGTNEFNLYDPHSVWKDHCTQV